jgi:hypothetical protein
MNDSTFDPEPDPHPGNRLDPRPDQWQGIGAQLDAISAFAHRKDPSIPGVRPAVEEPGTGQPAVAVPGRVPGRKVTWVRLADVLAGHSAGWSARGIDLTERLNQHARAAVFKGGKQARRVAGDTARSTAERVRTLPPVSAFGRSGATPARTPVTRSAIRRGRP